MAGVGWRSPACASERHRSCGGRAASGCDCECHDGLSAIAEGMRREAGTNVFSWEDPPEQGSGRRSPLYQVLAPAVDELREKPGNWAKLREYAKPMGASSAAQRSRGLFPDVTFTSRRGGEGGSVLYGVFEESDES